MNAQILLVLVVTLLVHRIIQNYLSFRKAYDFSRRGWYKPYRSATQWDPWGILFFLESLRNAKNHRFLQGACGRFEMYGNTYTSTYLGKPIIQTCEPANLRHVLHDKFSHFKLSSFRVNGMTPFFGENGIFTSDGETWKSFRALLRPCFSTKSIITFMDMSLEGHFKDFLTCIPRDGRKFDLQPLFYKFTMDIATEFFMGRSVRTLLDEKRGASLTKVSDRDFVEAYTCASEEVVHVIRLGVLGPLRINHKAQRARNIAFTYVEQFVDEVIQQRKSDPDASPPSVFLRNLAERTGDRGVLRSQILNMLLASRDTTASALSNLWWLLSRHPDVYSELRSEVSKTLNGRCPTYSDTQSMKYLSWCINESQRLLPTVPFNSREAVQDTYLPIGGGQDGKLPMRVEKGTQIYYHVHSMHRREDLFGSNTDEFHPERWEYLSPTWEFLPFSGGPRVCIGKQFALAEIGYLTIRLVQCFERIVARDERPWTEFYTLVASSKYGTHVSVTPATDWKS